MTDTDRKALLPAGLQDLLPPLADHEDALSRTLLDRFARFGYRRVKPPLVEFEDGLLDGVGAAVADQTFRIMADSDVPFIPLWFEDGDYVLDRSFFNKGYEES